jgi:DNA replication protein DnaC
LYTNIKNTLPENNPYRRIKPKLTIVHSTNYYLSNIIFYDDKITSAIIDRIVHDSYDIEIKSKTGQDHSMREIYGLKR